MKKKDQYDVVSLFSGCGGLDLGFRQAGFNVVWANDIEMSVRETYLQNHPNTPIITKDISKIDLSEIPASDGIIGGPPCQSWSVAGQQKGIHDYRGKLFLSYINIIILKQPKFFLIENVKGLLDEKFKGIFSTFLSLLENAGYEVHWKLLDSVNYGVPQNRSRIYIIGFLKNLHIKYIFPAEINERLNMLNAIGDLDCLNSVSNHEIYQGPFGEYYYRGNRRRAWNQPSFTIHATGENAPLHPSSPPMIYYGHENWGFQEKNLRNYRRLSVRECARIQSFPDSFVFKGENILSQYKMIGNAVPPKMGKILAESIKNALNNAKLG